MYRQNSTYRVVKGEWPPLTSPGAMTARYINPQPRNDIFGKWHPCFSPHLLAAPTRSCDPDFGLSHPGAVQWGRLCRGDKLPATARCAVSPGRLDENNNPFLNINETSGEWTFCHHHGDTASPIPVKARIHRIPFPEQIFQGRVTAARDAKKG